MATDSPDSPLSYVPDERQAMSAAEARVYVLEHPETQIAFPAQTWLRWVDLLEEARDRLSRASQAEILGLDPKRTEALLEKIDRALATPMRVGVPSVTIRAG